MNSLFIGLGGAGIASVAILTERKPGETLAEMFERKSQEELR